MHNVQPTTDNRHLSKRSRRRRAPATGTPRPYMPPTFDDPDDLDDLALDAMIDRLAGIQPECIGDLLELADRVADVAAIRWVTVR